MIHILTQKRMPNRPKALELHALGFSVVLAWTRIGRFHLIPRCVFMQLSSPFLLNEVKP